MLFQDLKIAVWNSTLQLSILFVFLFHFLPFPRVLIPLLRTSSLSNLICVNKYCFHSEYWQAVSIGSTRHVVSCCWTPPSAVPQVCVCVEALNWRSSWFCSRVWCFKCDKKLNVCMYVWTLSRHVLKKNGIHRKMKQMCMSSQLFLNACFIKKEIPTDYKPSKKASTSARSTSCSAFLASSAYLHCCCFLASALIPITSCPVSLSLHHQTHKDTQQIQNQDRL